MADGGPPTTPALPAPQPPIVMPTALPVQPIVPPVQTYSLTANSASSYPIIELVAFYTRIHR